jgi:hypothetical protein
MNDFEMVRVDLHTVIAQSEKDGVYPNQPGILRGSLAALDRIEAEIERLRAKVDQQTMYGHDGPYWYKRCQERNAGVERLQAVVEYYAKMDVTSGDIARAVLAEEKK